MIIKQWRLLFLFLPVLALAAGSCNTRPEKPADDLVKSINLKRGEIIVCGPSDKQFGTLSFSTSCSQGVKKDFDLAMALLHSFEYDEAEKMFARVIDADPQCPMAYWGVALCNYHLLWTPPSPEELEKGAKAIEIAKQYAAPASREMEYINAVASLYNDWKNTDHMTRCRNYEQALEKIYTARPGDREIAVLYSLALNAAADPSDASFQKQRKAGEILNALYVNEPNHPGVIHYIIHSYDNPEMANLALTTARRYASVAPSSSHALHMPSHIFTRLGLWDESIQSNIQSVTSAKCYAEETGIKGHWDEELHGLDYLVYAYLQKGDNIHAKEQLAYLKTINFISPINFKVAYSFAAIPSRYVLENKLWKEASALEADSANFEWKNFPWQKSIIHFTRLLGAVHSNEPEKARSELKTLNLLRDELIGLKDAYKAKQVEIQIKSGEAWILFREGKKDEGLKLLRAAADLEDGTQKHPVTPGEVIPARELLADMLMEMNKSLEALEAYESDLRKHPNRFNALYGAAKAAEKSKNAAKAKEYFQKLLQVSSGSGSDRIELKEAQKYVGGSLPKT